MFKRTTTLCPYTKMFRSWQAFTRLVHRPPAIDGEDDAIVALDAIFLGEQFQMARRGGPVDRAPVHPGPIFGQRLIFAAFAAQPLLPEAEPAIALEQALDRKSTRLNSSH